ncbi:hypothetical protein ACJ41O_007125 [Fusarium nematophilum]
MLLKNILSVAALAAAAYASPCRLSTSTALSSTETLSSTATATSTINTSASVTATTNSEASTAVATSTDTTSTALTTSAPETSTTEVQSTTTTSEPPAFTTFALAASNPRGSFSGNRLAIAGRSASLFPASNVPSGSDTAFHIDEATGRLLSGSGKALCAVTELDSAQVDPAALVPCTPEDGRTDNVLTCAEKASGELDCELDSKYGSYKYLYVDSDGAVWISTVSDLPAGDSGKTPFVLKEIPL